MNREIFFADAHAFSAAVDVDRRDASSDAYVESSSEGEEPEPESKNVV